MTIKTDEIIGVGHYIKKGDFVDIASILVSSDETKKIVSELTIENVEVLEVGKNPENVAEKDKEENASVTISVLASDVAKINYALTEGKYRLVLRSVVDKKIVSPAPYLQ
jgi:Flp pilus assembly protein CpaB